MGRAPWDGSGSFACCFAVVLTVSSAGRAGLSRAGFDEGRYPPEGESQRGTPDAHTQTGSRDACERFPATSRWSGDGNRTRTVSLEG